MFVEYENETSAQEAVAQLNGYRLDKAHSFKVNFFTDFDKYRELNLSADQIGEPVPYKNPGNLMWWLSRPEANDQFCLLHNDIHTSVYMNEGSEPAQLLKTREVIFQF